MSGDINPTHLDEVFAKSDMFYGGARHVGRGADLYGGRSERSSLVQGPSMSTSLCTSTGPFAWVTPSPSR
jgi:hypothetical protein